MFSNPWESYNNVLEHHQYLYYMNMNMNMNINIYKYYHTLIIVWKRRAMMSDDISCYVYVRNQVQHCLETQKHCNTNFIALDTNYITYVYHSKTSTSSYHNK